MPQTVSELSGLQVRLIEVQYYNYELVKVIVSPRSELQIDKIVFTRYTNCMKQHLAMWRGYNETLNSWVNVSDIKQV